MWLWEGQNICVICMSSVFRCWRKKLLIVIEFARLRHFLPHKYRIYKPSVSIIHKFSISGKRVSFFRVKIDWLLPSSASIKSPFFLCACQVTTAGSLLQTSVSCFLCAPRTHTRAPTHTAPLSSPSLHHLISLPKYRRSGFCCFSCGVYFLHCSLYYVGGLEPKYFQPR